MGTKVTATDEYTPGFKVPRIRGEWPLQAACIGADQSIFFTERTGNLGHLQVLEAKAICAKCDVRGPCREYGIQEKFGIWGGLTEHERRAERSRRARVSFQRRQEEAARDDPRQFISRGQRLGGTTVPDVDGPHTLPRAMHFAHRVRPGWSDE